MGDQQQISPTCMPCFCSLILFYNVHRKTVILSILFGNQMKKNRWQCIQTHACHYNDQDRKLKAVSIKKMAVAEKVQVHCDFTLV